MSCFNVRVAGTGCLRTKEGTEEMARILVAEDARAVREGIREILEAECHEVLEAEDGCEAFRAYALERPDLLVLDVAMPRLGGLEVCRRVRSSDAATPILLLSAKAGESDKVLGLGLGADDYVAKPFGMNELVARVNALLRRVAAVRGAGAPVGDVFPFGRWRVRESELALVDELGRRTDLTPREYAVIRYFATHPNEVVRRRALFDYAWGVGSYVYSRTLDMHVCAIRRKMAGCGWRIETVTGLGYRLRVPDTAA